jgi:hypothetical protein
MVTEISNSQELGLFEPQIHVQCAQTTQQRQTLAHSPLSHAQHSHSLQHDTTITFVQQTEPRLGSVQRRIIACREQRLLHSIACVPNRCGHLLTFPDMEMEASPGWLVCPSPCGCCPSWPVSLIRQFVHPRVARRITGIHPYRRVCWLQATLLWSHDGHEP